MFQNIPFNPYMANPQMMAQNPYSGQMTSMPSQNNPYTQQTQPNTPMVIYVPSSKDFTSVSVQPGKQALLIAQNEPYMAFKTADMMGQVQTSLYHIDSITEEQMNGPQPEYATKSELVQLQQVVQQIVDGLSNNKPQRTRKEGATE